MAPQIVTPPRFFLSTRGRGGRVVKAFDSKSNGVSPHRFESCPRRNILIDLIIVDWNWIRHSLFYLKHLHSGFYFFLIWHEIWNETYSITSSEICDVIMHRTGKERKVSFGVLFCSLSEFSCNWLVPICLWKREASARRPNSRFLVEGGDPKYFSNFWKTEKAMPTNVQIISILE